MTSSADRAINALRTGHDSLTALVQTLTPEQIAGPSGGASEWSVAQVLSHLGSGAEIGLAGLEASLTDAPAPGSDFNNSVWDRWNAKAPQDQADRFRQGQRGAGAAVRGPGRSDQGSGQGQAGLPAGADRHRGVGDASGSTNSPCTPGTSRSGLMTPPRWPRRPWSCCSTSRPTCSAGSAGRDRSWTAGSVAVHVQTTDPARDFGLVIGEKAELADRPADADAELTLPAESWLRLVSGRLAPGPHSGRCVRVRGDHPRPAAADLSRVLISVLRWCDGFRSAVTRRPGIRWP